MPTPSTPRIPDPVPPDPLQPILREVQEELQERLTEVCAREPVATESTGELIRLEDALLDAARAAKDMVSIRRRLRVEGPAVSGERATAVPVVDEGAAFAGDRPAETTREFVDDDGERWRVRAVTPGYVRPRGEAERLLGQYQHGWLAFDSLGGARRRRLPGVPDDWAGLAEEDLRQLLARAVEAARRGDR